MMIELVFWLFIGLSLLHLLVWCFPFYRLANYENKEVPKKEWPPVSIIICARNELENLSLFLENILKQDYPNYEVLLIDDGSTDDTSIFAERLQKKYPKLSYKYITATEKGERIGKKFPLSKGIEMAKHELLLLTDADCAPKSDQWLGAMVAALAKDKSIVLGYSPYRSTSGWLNRFIRYEAVYTAMQYLGMTLIGQPYMGVGRNILYRKSVYKAAGGFAKHAHIASGDDDLLINAVADKANTTINISPSSHVLSEPKMTLRAYYRQKTRHLTAGTQYKWQHQLMLGGMSLSHFGFYVLGLFMLLIAYKWKLVMFLMLLMALWKFYLYQKILKKLSEEKMIPYVLLLDALFVFYYLIFIPNLLKAPTNNWK